MFDPSSGQLNRNKVLVYFRRPTNLLRQTSWCVVVEIGIEYRTKITTTAIMATLKQTAKQSLHQSDATVCLLNALRSFFFLCSSNPINDSIVERYPKLNQKFYSRIVISFFSSPTFSHASAHGPSEQLSAKNCILDWKWTISEIASQTKTDSSSTFDLRETKTNQWCRIETKIVWLCGSPTTQIDDSPCFFLQNATN